jgi:flagellar protein FlbD
MIRLTRLNNQAFTVNSDLIKFVEESPDTLVTLINGEKIVVRESADEILRRVVVFRRSVFEGLSSTSNWDSSASRLAPAERLETEREPPK